MKVRRAAKLSKRLASARALAPFRCFIPGTRRLHFTRVALCLKRISHINEWGKKHFKYRFRVAGKITNFSRIRYLLSNPQSEFHREIDAMVTTRWMCGRNILNCKVYFNDQDAAMYFALTAHKWFDFVQTIPDSED